jgi:hypothetical protein
MRATLRVEIINLTNTPWFAALSTTNVNAANFAQVTTQGKYSRLAQMTLRFSY